MKRFVCVLLVVAMFSMNTLAVAESGGFWGSIGGIFDDVLGAIDEAADAVWDWTETAAGDVWSWTETAAGDVWNWAEIAANDAWNWTSTAAGDVWDWTSEAASDAWAWTSATATNSWAWTEQQVTDIAGSVGDWMSKTGEDALSELQDVWNMLLSEAGVAADEAADLWNMLMKYADLFGISPLKIAKLGIAIVIRVCLGDAFIGDMARDYIKDALIGWINVFGVKDEKSADSAIDNFMESAKGFFSTGK